jgi:hypothetical protein
MPITDREPLLSDGIVIAPEDEDEDVITPSCAAKSLRFWSRYYLRWDPAISGADRDAGVEIESAHCNLQHECDEMRTAVTNLRRELRRERTQREPRSTAPAADRRHSAPVACIGSGVESVNRWAERVADVGDSDVSARVDAVVDTLGVQHEPLSSVAQADRAAELAMMRPPIPSIITTDIGPDEQGTAAASQRATIEAQIARLREQKQQRMMMVEKSFEAQIARLQRQHEAMDE